MPQRVTVASSASNLSARARTICDAQERSVSGLEVPASDLSSIPGAALSLSAVGASSVLRCIPLIRLRIGLLALATELRILLLRLLGLHPSCLELPLHPVLEAAPDLANSARAAQCITKLRRFLLRRPGERLAMLRSQRRLLPLPRIAVACLSTALSLLLELPLELVPGLARMLDLRPRLIEFRALNSEPLLIRCKLPAQTDKLLRRLLVRGEVGATARRLVGMLLVELGEGVADAIHGEVF
mmetsp:Transcript_25619/g.56496  ORF Transcript_25619/g.56496 Transcript_25619/m.56496 type:complete len:242 (+) Transcript_25619:328-1053(+)